MPRSSNCSAAIRVRVAHHFEDASAMKIQISYTGRSYQTASLIPAELTLDENATINDALLLLTKDLNADQQLPASCLVAVSGEHIGTLASYTNRTLRDRDELILIAPVAGG